MTIIRAILAVFLFLSPVSAFAQTVRALSFNTTNNTIIGPTNTNALKFTNSIMVGPDFEIVESQFFFAGLIVFEWETQTWFEPFNFEGATVAATTRTNLFLGLPALTNTSNVTMMRALSGSTNTNHPFSGTVSVVGTNNTNTLTFSNGILQSVQ